MKEELLKVLNTKLDDIKKDINSLNELNKKIEEKEDLQEYTVNTLKSFKENDGYNILKFDGLSKEDFEKVISIVSNNAEKLFSTPSCNYDGLIYLIAGINKGVSLSLTDEQKSGIEFLIRGLNEKQKEFKTNIEKLQAEKARFKISDVDELEKEKEIYENIIRELDEEKYIVEIDEVYNAINFASLNGERVIALLKYLLEYNSDVHTRVKINHDDNKINYEEPEQKEERDIPLYEAEIDDKHEDMSTISIANVEKKNLEEANDSYSPYVFNKEYDENNTDKQSFEVEEVKPITVEDKVYQQVVSEDIKEDENEEITESDKVDDENSIDEVSVVNPDLSLDVQNDEYEIHRELNTSETNNEVKKLFDEYNLNVSITSLNDSDIDKYRKIISTLKENNLLEKIAQNEDLFKGILTKSDEKEIENIIRIVRDDLSIDKEDYEMTMDIVIDTIPSIFINEDGNYKNFIKNCQKFENYGLNLIKLFDFSKEIFIVDTDTIENNHDIVVNYHAKLDYNNAKYLLVLPDIAERMDYYVESEYTDKTKNNEIFNGTDYINNYTVKLSTVTPETIKRLRFASENEKKVFGSKPNSLAGEITNLKVKAMEIPDLFMNNFFDNNFDGLSSDEVREFKKLVHHSSNVGNYNDELSKLEKYRVDDMKYRIEGILVSVNKVERNYNVLRSYGIDAHKALHFAVCNNLIITKDEYKKIKNVLEDLGGNA